MRRKTINRAGVMRLYTSKGVLVVARQYSGIGWRNKVVKEWQREYAGKGCYYQIQPDLCRQKHDKSPVELPNVQECDATKAPVMILSRDQNIG